MPAWALKRSAFSMHLCGRGRSKSALVGGQMKPRIVLVVFVLVSAIQGHTAPAIIPPTPYCPRADCSANQRDANQKSQHWRQRQDLFQGATTDLSGHFRLRGLAPGEYQVIAVDEDIDEEITDPEFISAHESEGLTIKVQEGERKSIILKLPPSSD